MTNAEIREEIKAAIAWYEERGKCWLSVVTFIGFRALFGTWAEVAIVRRDRQKK